jgi:hypothetical protein
MKEVEGQKYPKTQRKLKPSEILLLDTLLPGEAHSLLPAGIWQAGFEEFWHEFMRTAPPDVILAFKAAVWTGTWIAPLLIRRLPPLARYDRPTREQALAALGMARLPVLRQMLAMLKLISSFCYGADPQVRQAIGYPDRMHIKPDRTQS